jgi:hypothetical protein
MQMRNSVITRLALIKHRQTKKRISALAQLDPSAPPIPSVRNLRPLMSKNDILNSSNGMADGPVRTQTAVVDRSTSSPAHREKLEACIRAMSDIEQPQRRSHIIYISIYIYICGPDAEGGLDNAPRTSHNHICTYMVAGHPGCIRRYIFKSPQKKNI